MLHVLKKMDQLIIDIKEKLPKNCIYKIALLASVFAGKNDYCHHILIAEKVRPIIIEFQDVSTYAFNKIFSSRYNKGDCKKICKNIQSMNGLLNYKIRNIFQEFQHKSKSYFTMEKHHKSELYYPIRKSPSKDHSLKVYRGTHYEYNGYFKINNIYRKIKKNADKYNENDIREFKDVYNRINSIMIWFNNEPIISGIKNYYQVACEYDKVCKKINKLLDEAFKLFDNYNVNETKIYMTEKEIKNLYQENRLKYRFKHPYVLKIWDKDAYAFNRDYNFVGKIDKKKHDIDQAHDRCPERNYDNQIYLYNDGTKPWEDDNDEKIYLEKLAQLKLEYNFIY